MIRDAENLFIDKVAGTTYGTSAKYSNIVANGGGGSAYESPFLAVNVSVAALAGGNLGIVVQTDDAEAFSAPQDIATYTVPAESKGDVLAERLPFGLKKFIRLKVTGSAAITAGVITAGLVLDADMK